MMRRVLTWTSLALMVLIAVGYGGAWHPGSDSVAVFRPQLAVALAGLSLIIAWCGRRALALLGFALAAVAAGPLFWLGFGAEPLEGRVLKLYQKNMLFRVADPAALGQDILQEMPDFVTLQEVSGANMAVFDTLGARFASRQFCPFETIGGVAVASRWPIVPDSAFCAEADGLAAMQVSTPAGDVWVVSIHLHWPWPYQQPAHVNRLLPFLEKLDGQVAIGGDFNMVPWSHTMQQIAEVSGTERIGPARVTLTKRGGWLRVPIDHVLVSGGVGDTTRRARLGSDHFGVLARFQLARDRVQH